MRTSVLLLGAGTGGIIAARELNKHISKDRKTDNIIVFEKEEKNVFAPSLLWLMVGKRRKEKVYRRTEKIACRGVEVVLGKVEQVDPEKKTVTANGKTYTGDYMIVSLGAEQVTAYGLDKCGFDFFTLDGAAAFYEKLKNFSGGKIVVLVPSLPFKCPAAPYEAAMLIEGYIRKKGLRNKTEIAVYTPEPGPMPVAGLCGSSGLTEH